MPTLLKIRTVTVGISFERDEPSDVRIAALDKAAAFLAAAQKRFEDAGYEVQTTRISTNSFEEWCDVGDKVSTLRTMRAIDAELVRLGINLFNAGPASTAAGMAIAPAIISLGPRISASGALLDPLDLNGAMGLAAAILRITETTTGGEGNFQFCTSVRGQEHFNPRLIYLFFTRLPLASPRSRLKVAHVCDSRSSTCPRASLSFRRRTTRGRPRSPSAARHQRSSRRPCPRRAAT